MYPLGLAPYKKTPSDLVLCWALTGAWIEIQPGLLIFRARRQGVNAFQHRLPTRVGALTCDQMHHHHHHDWLVD